MGPFPHLRLYLLHTSSHPFFGSACRVTNSENGKPFFSETEVFLALLFREAFFQLSFFVWESVAGVQQFAIGEGGWQGNRSASWRQKEKHGLLSPVVLQQASKDTRQIPQRRRRRRRGENMQTRKRKKKNRRFHNEKKCFSYKPSHIHLWGTLKFLIFLFLAWQFHTRIHHFTRLLVGRSLAAGVV